MAAEGGGFEGACRNTFNKKTPLLWRIRIRRIRTGLLAEFSQISKEFQVVFLDVSLETNQLCEGGGGSPSKNRTRRRTIAADGFPAFFFCGGDRKLEKKIYGGDEKKKKKKKKFEKKF